MPFAMNFVIEQIDKFVVLQGLKYENQIKSICCREQVKVYEHE